MGMMLDSGSPRVVVSAMNGSRLSTIRSCQVDWTYLDHFPHFVLPHSQLFLAHTFRFDPFQLRASLCGPPDQRIILFQFLLSTINDRL